jgi:ubiquitin-conjugating enzyme E2 D
LEIPPGDPSSHWKRLWRESKDWKNFPNEILSLSPVDERSGLRHLSAVIRGPVDTPYENEIFVLDIQVPSDYPYKPPKVKFITKVFHPNISSKGEICLDTLGTMWRPACSIEKTLLSIVALLSDPNTDDFLEPESAYLYKENRKEYNRIARKWTQKYSMTIADAAEAQENINEVSSLNYSEISRSPWIL